VINLYRDPIIHAEDMGDWIRYDNIGLKGEVSHWVKEHVQEKPHWSIERVNNSDPNFDESHFTDQADLIIYSVGFGRLNYPSVSINSRQVNSKKFYDSYNKDTLKIYENMWGLGIGFPQRVVDRENSVQMAVGLKKFVNASNTIFEDPQIEIQPKKMKGTLDERFYA